MRVSLADYQAALDRTEADLTELAQRLDTEVPRELYTTALLALAHRARTLFIGLTSLLRGEVPAAGVPLLRSAIEINLTLRFLIANPELHVELWTAEGERQNAVLAKELEADRELAEKVGLEAFGADWFAETEQFVESARQRALEAGVVGISGKKNKPVMPNMQSIAVNHGSLAEREAYTLAYRSLSQFTHGSSRAFGRNGFTQAPDGRVRFDDVAAFSDGEVRSHRALNITTFASTLCIVSGPLGCNVLDEAETIKAIILELGVDAD